MVAAGEHWRVETTHDTCRRGEVGQVINSIPCSYETPLFFWSQTCGFIPYIHHGFAWGCLIFVGGWRWDCWAAWIDLYFGLFFSTWNDIGVQSFWSHPKRDQSSDLSMISACGCLDLVSRVGKVSYFVAGRGSLLTLCWQGFRGSHISSHRHLKFCSVNVSQDLFSYYTSVLVIISYHNFQPSPILHVLVVRCCKCRPRSYHILS